MKPKRMLFAGLMLCGVFFFGPLGFYLLAPSIPGIGIMPRQFTIATNFYFICMIGFWSFILPVSIVHWHERNTEEEITPEKRMTFQQWSHTLMLIQSAQNRLNNVMSDEEIEEVQSELQAIQQMIKNE